MGAGPIGEPCEGGGDAVFAEGSFVSEGAFAGVLEAFAGDGQADRIVLGSADGGIDDVARVFQRENQIAAEVVDSALVIAVTG